MNYWPRYVGDIQRKTGHLSCAEMGAYDRLLDHVYATEEPLPADVDACCRIARAMDKSERQAVASVLRQFFTLTEAGYSNARAVEEIAKDKPRREAAKANGMRGGRPRTTEREPNGNPAGYPAGTQDEPRTKAPQPQPQHQHTPSDEGVARKRAARSSKTAMPEDFAVSPRVQEWAKDKGFDRLSEHLEAFRAKAKAKGYTYADWDSAFMEAIREDWANLRGRTPNGAAPPLERQESGSTAAEETAQRIAERRSIVPDKPPAAVLELAQRMRAQA